MFFPKIVMEIFLSRYIPWKQEQVEEVVCIIKYSFEK